MKKILVSLLVLSMALSAVACTAKPAPTTSSSSAASAITADVETPNLTGNEHPVASLPTDQEYAEYSGKFVSINKEAGQLVAEDDKGEQFVFNFDDETIFTVPADNLKPGDQLYVRHSMAVTFSLPPQSYAFEFSDVAPAVRTDANGQSASSQGETDKLYVADAALYRGVMQDVAVDDSGNTVWMLEQAVGTDYGHKSLKVTLTADTKYSFDTAAVGNGAYLEVFYGGEPDANGVVEAIAVNDAGPLDLVIYNGVIKEINAEDGAKKGSILLDSIEAGGMGYQFNYDESTQFYTDFTALKPGMKLNVYHSPVSTRSLPPQSMAFEISLMAE